MPFRLRSEHISERLTVEVDTQAVECEIVELAAGTWWNTTSHTALSIALEGSGKNPTVKQLNQFARIGAAKLGLKPLVLG